MRASQALYFNNNIILGEDFAYGTISAVIGFI